MARKKSTKKKSAAKKQVETLTHDQERRTNIPTAELESVMEKDQQRPTPVHYPRPTPGPEMQEAIDQRDRDLDPQLVWRGKDTPAADGADPDRLTVQAPPLFIQEKVHPKVLIDDLRRQTEAVEIARKLADPAAQAASPEDQLDLFADFNGIPDHADAKTEFYQHDANWTNRMILGDSLAVMASLAEREGLRGQVQCIYLDPPYGIKFNSNFQWSTTSRDVKDGKADHITREPEQVKAFRDTWRDGIHSYLTYLVPSWMKAEDGGAPRGPINARAETAASKPMFRSAMKGRRCVVPTTGFYEWQKRDRGPKQPYLVSPAGDRFLALAGLWERWRGPDGQRLESYAILTTDANATVRPIHDRMPVVLDPGEFDRWLDPDTPADAAAELLDPFADAGVEAASIGRAINNPKNDAPEAVVRQ